MKKFLLAVVAVTAAAFGASADEPSFIETTGSATLNIVPDRITVEIGLEEYYNKSGRDSSLVSLTDIERNVRSVLKKAGVADSMVFVSSVGNYLNPRASSTLLMAERLSATLTGFSQLDNLIAHLDRRGITSFNITGLDNSNMEEYNRQGLKAALEAARTKALFIARQAGFSRIFPYIIEDTTNEMPGYGAASNVFLKGGSGMDAMRRINKRYSVRAKYFLYQ